MISAPRIVAALALVVGLVGLAIVTPVRHKATVNHPTRFAAIEVRSDYVQSQQPLTPYPPGMTMFFFSFDSPGIVEMRIWDSARWRTRGVVFMGKGIVPITGRRRLLYEVGAWR